MVQLLSTLTVIFIVAPFLIWTFLSFYSKSKRIRISSFKLIVWLSILIGFSLAAVMIVLMVYLM